MCRASFAAPAARVRRAGSSWVGRTLTSANSAATKKPLSATSSRPRASPSQGFMEPEAAPAAVGALGQGKGKDRHSGGSIGMGGRRTQ